MSQRSGYFVAAGMLVGSVAVAGGMNSMRPEPGRARAPVPVPVAVTTVERILMAVSRHAYTAHRHLRRL